MAAGGIEAPYAIASIPRPLDAEFGQTQAAPVLSFSGQKKRKRHEVAIGIDGECVNIYNVQTSDLVTSYAIPPQAYLAAPPCAIFRKRTRPLNPERRTYTALRDSPQSTRTRLLCFSEDLGGAQRSNDDLKAPSKRECKLQPVKVSAVNVVPAPRETGDELPFILVSYENGNVDCFDGDLTAKRWSFTAPESQAVQVKLADVIDLATARKGVLKGREDVLASIDPAQSPSADRHTYLMCHVEHHGENVWLRIFVLRNTSRDALRSDRSSLDELLAFEIPARSKQTTASARYELHGRSGALIQCSDQRLTLFDLSGTVPKVQVELGRKAMSGVGSFARLSASSLMLVASDHIAVYETRFGSLTSSLLLTENNSTALADDRHKQPKKPTSQRLLIVSHYVELGLIVAIAGSQLVALQLGESLRNSRRSKSSGPSLLDVVGKGRVLTEDQSLALAEEKASKRKKLGEWRAKVDQLIEGRDVAGLEALIARDIHLELDSQSDYSREISVESDVRPADLALQSSFWDLSASEFDPQFVSGKRASYILRKMFAWESTHLEQSTYGSYRLVVVLRSRNILRWLALAGYLSPSNVSRVLAPPKNGTRDRQTIKSGDIMNAVGQVDKEFLITYDLMTLPIHWDLAEVMQGLKLLVQSLDDQAFLSIEDARPDETVATVNNDIDAQIAAEVAAADAELAHARSVIEHGLQIRSEALRVLLNRLELFPKKEITSTMQSILSHKEIFFFICVLRIELADGGWTSRYINNQDEDADAFDRDNLIGLGNAQQISPSDRAIRTIANLLSCAVDAIGISGWLVSRNGESVGAQDLLHSLINEVSAALSGSIEANRLDTMMREFCRTAGAGSSALKRKLVENADFTPEQAAMPLGGRVNPPTVSTWASRDAKKTRTMIAEERNRAVGKYAFETIRI